MSKILAFVRSNAIALLALFVALGGTSYAAIAIPKNSVGTRQLRSRAVTESKLGKESVTATNLNGKSIAGYVADWAQIRADGLVTVSRPSVSVGLPDPSRGVYQVYWHRAIPQDCMAIANPVNVAPLTARATAETFGPSGQGSNSHIVVSTFDAAGDNVPENINVLVVCP